MKILLIKSALCPNDKYFEITLKSLIKTNIFIQMIKKDNNITFDLLFIGWTYTYNKKIDMILDIIKTNFENIYKEYWAINYGKYKILNYCIDFIKDNNYNYIIYMDHDIHFDLYSANNFMKIFEFDNLEINSKKVGLIALNQKGDIRHQPSIYENKYLDNIVWPNDDTSIASGAFVIKSCIFQLLKPFELKIVYGLDDYLLCKQLSNMEYINVVFTSCYVMHPFDCNDNFKKWKENNIKKLINNEPINYYQNIEESLNLFTIQ